MRAVFKDEKLQERFEQDGYVKLKLFTSEQLSKLRSYYDTVRQPHEAAIQNPSLYSSVDTGNSELLINLDKLVKGMIMEQVDSVFKNYQTLISNYLVKESGDNTELMPHQDLSFVNEPEECSFNVWIPLQETNSKSGQLRILKGSHRIREMLRVVPEYPRPFVRFQDTIRELFTDIETTIGECVVINHSVVHGSTVNLTGQPRVAVILSMCSAPANVYYYYMPNGDSSKIEKYLMRPEDYYYFNSDGRPAKAKLADTISYSFEHTSEETFKAWIKQDEHLGFLTKLKLLYFKSLSNA